MANRERESDKGTMVFHSRQGKTSAHPDTEYSWRNGHCKNPMSRIAIFTLAFCFLAPALADDKATGLKTQETAATGIKPDASKPEKFSYAQPFPHSTGADLLPFCANTEDVVAQVRCDYYIQGVADLATIPSPLDGKPMACIPRGKNRTELMTVALQHLSKAPSTELAEKSAASMLLLAFRKAYPCEIKKAKPTGKLKNLDAESIKALKKAMKEGKVPAVRKKKLSELDKETLKALKQAQAQGKLPTNNKKKLSEMDKETLKALKRAREEGKLPTKQE